MIITMIINYLYSLFSGNMLLIFYISYDNRDYYLKGRNNDDDSICDDVFEWIEYIDY